VRLQSLVFDLDKIVFVLDHQIILLNNSFQLLVPSLQLVVAIDLTRVTFGFDLSFWLAVDLVQSLEQAVVKRVLAWELVLNSN
jgi:hypothetical protein